MLRKFMETLGTIIVRVDRRKARGVFSMPADDPVALEVAD
jgi:hypothetical protein